MSYPIFSLRKNMDRRFQRGHPWVYSNEVLEIPKNLQAGDLVELRDAKGKFLARGFGNPHSLIAFRALTRQPEDQDLYSIDFLVKKIKKAGELRKLIGRQHSYRLFFGEADFFPGLIIDRYFTANACQVFVVQAHSAGADRILPQIDSILKAYVLETSSASHWNQTAIVIRNDLSIRKKEGLQEENPRILKDLSRLMDLSHCEIQVAAALGEAPLLFSVDLLHGQKTGFFLDQFSNIQLACQLLQGMSWHNQKKIRILDLCCYVGQWGAQVVRTLKKFDLSLEVLAMDVSADSLQFAQKNIEKEGAHCDLLKGDVLRSLGTLTPASFDVVISDPPALIQNRKDIAVGTHAYLQLATQAFRLLKPTGMMIACSCSSLLTEEAFKQLLSKAARRNQQQLVWIASGQQSADHPMLLEFPEGQYLKSWIGINRSL